MKKISFLSLLFFVLTIDNQIFSQCDTCLVDLKSVDTTFVLDIRYATTNNFVGKILYKSSKAYLRKEAADSLKKVNDYLKRKYNLQLKIFDAYRPLSVQKIMWEIIQNPDFVADPKKGSRHNRGAAVDATLIDSLGRELEMGTEFDDFSEKASRKYLSLPEESIRNRKILEETMSKFGFIGLESEWWHFDFYKWKEYSILDIDID